MQIVWRLVSLRCAVIECIFMRNSERVTRVSRRRSAAVLIYVERCICAVCRASAGRSRVSGVMWDAVGCIYLGTYLIGRAQRDRVIELHWIIYATVSLYKHVWCLRCELANIAHIYSIYEFRRYAQLWGCFDDDGGLYKSRLTRCRDDASINRAQSLPD